MITVIRGDCFTSLTHLYGHVDLVCCDPPYGGIIKGAAWADVPVYDRITALVQSLLKPGGTAYVWGGTGTFQNRPFFKWLSEIEAQRGHELRIWDVITWSKRRAYGTANRYLYTREECAMLVKGDKPKTFHVPLLEEKRGYPGFNKDFPAKSEFKRRTNVWTDINELFKGKIHPAEKPSRLAEVMIETSSNPGDLIVDPFAGCGSTAIGARAVGDRDVVLCELSNCPMHIGLEGDDF